MKKLISLILCFICIFAFTGCNNNATAPSQEENQNVSDVSEANSYITKFFSSYTQMCEYIKRSDIALSSRTIAGVDLASVLKAPYQARSVSFKFTVPVKVSENSYTFDVTVKAPDMDKLYTAYLLDTSFDPETDLMNSFYRNINDGGTTTVESESITLTLTRNNDVWHLSSNNALAYALFPNIDLIND